MKYRYNYLAFALILFTQLAFKKPDKIKVYLIGDSTVCLYPVRQFPVCGWGMPFADYFDSRVAIDNRAKGGRSTRTFIGENRWQPIADSLMAGDYVMIQFGHNDEAKEPQYASRYTPVPDYKVNLIKFITETRSKGASPILVTPVSRRNFDQAGNAKETHIEYTKAVYEIGAQTQTPVIDLDKQSRDYYQMLGPSRSKLLFLELDSAEHPNYPKGRHDNTHFNEYGARLMAEIVLNDIKAKRLDLANYIVKAKE